MEIDIKKYVLPICKASINSASKIKNADEFNDGINELLEELRILLRDSIQCSLVDNVARSVFPDEDLLILTLAENIILHDLTIDNCMRLGEESKDEKLKPRFLRLDEYSKNLMVNTVMLLSLKSVSYLSNHDRDFLMLRFEEIKNIAKELGIDVNVGKTK